MNDDVIKKAAVRKGYYSCRMYRRVTLSQFRLHFIQYVRHMGSVKMSTVKFFVTKAGTKKNMA